jgi:nucleotide-binding universal stress UspA family protein
MSTQRPQLPSPSLDRLVVGIDFEAPSLTAVQWLRERFAPDSEMHLVHTVDIPYPGTFLEAPFPSHLEVLEEARKDAEERLREVAVGLPGSRFEIREGSPEEGLCHVAQEIEANLVVVGEHGRGRPRWNLLGSTAERLLHLSPAPVLLARGLLRDPPGHLLVPVDDSGLAAGALAWARFLGHRFEAQVTLLHVVSRAFPGHIQRVSSKETAADLEREMERQAGRWLEEESARAGLTGPRVSRVLRRGSPSYEILSEAARCHGDLIVMGSRGRGAASRWLLGSVAATVIRGGSLPVLVARDSRSAPLEESS